MSKSTNCQFSEFGLNPSLLQAIEFVGYESPSSIQSECIPVLMQGRDLIGVAQTGTGKTAAFALPLLDRVDTAIAQPQLLVLTPTRELCIQVAEAMQVYARFMRDFHILPIYGGQSMHTQLKQLKRGVQVVVGTPGRILDHIRRKSLKFDAIHAVVLDEADEMLKMGFIDDVETILQCSSSRKQTALFSATMPNEIRAVAQKYLSQPIEVKIKAKTATVATISQSYCVLSHSNKLEALTRILEVADTQGLIIFVRTKTATQELSEKLSARGFSCAAINGDLSQSAREATISRLKKGSLDVLVATDVAARGLDVERISHVINYDVPYDAETYIHRIGRTGRAGRKGQAILFITPREKRMLSSIEKTIGQKISPLEIPSTMDVANQRTKNFIQTVKEAVEKQALIQENQLAQRLCNELGCDYVTLSAALIQQIQSDNPQFAAHHLSGAPIQNTVKKIKSKKPIKETLDRNDSKNRNDSNRSSPKQKRARAPKKHDLMVDKYRIEVGIAHKVKPNHIVGAIANEAGIQRKYIGKVEIFDQFSTIELPEGMPKEIYKQLKRVWVCGRQLRINKLSANTPV